MPSAHGLVVVDVLITNHNYARFLEQALESACAQTHPDVNVIAVDDGSTDSSREILARYADRVEVVLKARGGQASAINAGLEHCEGDVLMLLDADDRLHPAAAARVAEAMDAEPGLAKVQFRMDVVDDRGEGTGETRPEPGFDPPAGDMRGAELAFPFDIPWLPGGGTAFRSSAIARVTPIPETDFPRWGADWYLVHLSALLGPAGVLDEALADYRLHGANGYERSSSTLDLDRVRDSIAYASATSIALEDLADKLGLSRPERVLSTADLANRLISLRLDPEHHPVVTDSRTLLVADAVRALRRRFDVGLPVKVVFAGWFAAEAIAPRRVAVWLAEVFLFPERRSAANRMLRRSRRPKAAR